jgi:hypothetical protein
MKKIALVIAIAFFASSTAGLQARPGGGGGGGGRGGGGGGRSAPSRQTASRPAPSNPGRGFNMGNDVPSSRPGYKPPQQQQRPQQQPNRPSNTASNGNSKPGNGNNNNNKPGNSNGNNNNKPGNGNGNGNGNNSGNNNGNRNNGNGNNNNINSGNKTVNNNNVNVNRNYNGYNGYGYHGTVVVNPVYRGPAWGWNHGAVWTPYPSYWGGGFWGAFAVGATTAAVMGAVVNSNQTYTSYQVQQSSPGATLLSNYGLQQVQCGSPNLVVIYGPNNGVICANPNGQVAAGNYAVNENNLTLQSQ